MTEQHDETTPSTQAPRADQAPQPTPYDAAQHTAPGAAGQAPTQPHTTDQGDAAALHRDRRFIGIIGAAAAVTLLAGVGGLGAGFVGGTMLARTSAAGSSSTQATLPQSRPFGSDGSGSGSTDGDGFGGLGRGSGGTGSGSSGTTSSSTATAATAAQRKGVVTIVSDLYYGQGEAAGTGIVLSANGLILTNNHVIQGATKIEVTDEDTGKSYTADVVGTDATNDVAVLRLQGASGLAVSTLDTKNDVMTGDDVTSIGNANGTGTLVAASGAVTDLQQQITVSNEETGKQETLSNLIEVNADVVSGDSGGPLVDTDGEVVGIVTAASQGGSDIAGFAIPIDDAMAIAKQIEAGTASDTVVIGLPAFLGVELATAQTATTGVGVSGIIADSGAAAAGLAAGDVITSVDGQAVADSTALSAAVAAKAPGDTVTLGITTAAGASRQVQVVLGAGPAA